jgi:hypothetical protein
MSSRGAKRRGIGTYAKKALRSEFPNHYWLLTRATADSSSDIASRNDDQPPTEPMPRVNLSAANIIESRA